MKCWGTWWLRQSHQPSQPSALCPKDMTHTGPKGGRSTTTLLCRVAKNCEFHLFQLVFSWDYHDYHQTIVDHSLFPYWAPVSLNASYPKLSQSKDTIQQFHIPEFISSLPTKGTQRTVLGSGLPLWSFLHHPICWFCETINVNWFMSLTELMMWSYFFNIWLTYSPYHQYDFWIYFFHYFQ